MKKGKILMWAILGFTLAAGPQGNAYAASLNRAEKPVQLAGLFDKLLDPNSKENKILQGAT
ncbi:MAG TPA: hypothetical protein HPP58_05090, partial [Deltaproteobacteria bacterium]|nr:hypothetical protein [Deltaproteobacteria bacterium]